MKNKKILFLIPVVVLILCLGFFVNKLLNRIPQNPDGTVGNIAGNLHNNGLFCENDNKVYFSNPYDQGTLYVMNPDETEIQKLNSVKVQSLNVAGKYIYYYQLSTGEGEGLGYAVKTSGLYRSKTNGKKVVCLKRDPVGVAALIDNSIFYQHLSENEAVKLDRIAIDKANEETLFTNTTSPACVMDGIIYYTNPDSMQLYTYNTYTKINSLLWDHPVWNPVYHNDGYIYFMDLETNYELHRYQPFTGEEQVLTKERVEMFNVYDDYIYYQRTSKTEPALMRMHTDGSQLEVVAYGVYTNINMTSRYVYYNEFQKPIPMYHQSLRGPIQPTVFDASGES